MKINVVVPSGLYLPDAFEANREGGQPSDAFALPRDYGEGVSRAIMAAYAHAALGLHDQATAAALKGPIKQSLYRHTNGCNDEDQMQRNWP